MIRSAATEELVARLRPTLGEAVLDRIAAQLKLPGEEPAYRLKSAKVLVMLFAARAGSTYVGTLIENLPQFGVFTESLNPRALERARERYGVADHGASLQHFLDHRGKEAFGFRCTHIGLASAVLTGFLSQFRDRLAFVVLRRRDVTAQAVSMVLARMSGQFHSYQARPNEVALDDYDFAAIDERRQRIESIYARHEQTLAALGASGPTYFYEDIVADPSGFVAAICDHVGIAMPADVSLDTRAEKLPNAINAEWIRRYDEECEAAPAGG